MGPGAHAKGTGTTEACRVLHKRCNLCLRTVWEQYTH